MKVPLSDACWASSSASRLALSVEATDWENAAVAQKSGARKIILIVLTNFLDAMPGCCVVSRTVALRCQRTQVRIILATRAKVGASGEPSFATTLPDQPYVAGMRHDHFRALLSCFDV